MKGRLTKKQLELKKRMEGFVFTLFQEGGMLNDSEYKRLRDSRSIYNSDEEYMEAMSRKFSSWVKCVFVELKDTDDKDLKRIYGALIK
jgi:hypothetical protein